MAALAVVMLALLVVQIGLTGYGLHAAARWQREDWKRRPRHERGRAILATGLGFAASTALAVGLWAGDHGVVVGIAVFVAAYGLLMAPLAIWLDRRTGES
jgi:hypothetical protein